MSSLRSFVFLIVVAAWTFLGSLAFAQSPEYIDELSDRARALGLSDDPAWLALLHFPTWAEGARASGMDDPRFFLSPSGRSEPGAELAATLRRFLDSPQTTIVDNQHAQCLFAARYRWLKSKLAFDPHRLPEQPCPRLEVWLKNLAPNGISLIFPEAYMNNPSSMFGHTMLRVDDREQGEGTGLLGYAVNFAATTGDDGGVAFAWKGLTGGYVGMFSLLPYYDKVTEYSDWENRDMWEYALNLDPKAQDLLLRHVWELRGIEVQYYFFTRNCSFELLGLLEVARPGTGFQRGFSTHAIPVDTIRAVTAVPGLVRNVAWRPSPETHLRRWAQDLPPDQLQLALRIATGELAADAPELSKLADSDHARVMEMAYHYLRFRFLDHKIEVDEAQPRAHRILTARARIDHELASPQPERPRITPEQGHRTSRMALGVGWKDDQPFLRLSIRPAFHDVLNPQGGYTAGAEINFLDLTLRYEPRKNQGVVESLAILDILSLAPLGAILERPSWSFQTVVERRPLPRKTPDTFKEGPVSSTQGGIGATFSLPGHVWVYAMAEAEGQVAAGLQDHYAFGLGPSAGIILSDAEDKWRARLSGRSREFFWGDTHTEFSTDMEASYRLDDNDALSVGASRHDAFGHAYNEFRLTWSRFF